MEEEPELTMKQRNIMIHQHLKKMSPFSLRVQLRVPPMTMATIREYVKLPEKYCDACTLREGTIVSMLILETVSILTIACLVILLVYCYDDTEYYWQEKFTADFDPYLENENAEFILSLWTLWDEFFFVIIISEGASFVTALGVIFALLVKTAHPAWYIPWITVTAFLVTSCFIISFILLIFNCVVGTFRYISVTWDLVPMILTFLWSCNWYYSLVTVIAHYKRRRIVKYWRDSKKFIGGDNDSSEDNF